MTQTRCLHGKPMTEGLKSTKPELLCKSFKVKKEDLKEHQEDSILEKCGGQQPRDASAADLLLAQTEAYVEYSGYDTAIKEQERAVPALHMKKT